MNRTIYICNESSVITDNDARAAVNALQKQVDRDFAPVYGFGCTLKFQSGKPPSGVECVHILDDAHQADTEGYHDLGKGDVPEGFCFAKTTIDDGNPWQTTLSHEVLEQLLDPWCDLLVSGPIKGKPAAIAYECADPTEDDQYLIDGIPVSNFVLPAWFNGETGKTDFLGKLQGLPPFSLTAGGYVSYTTDIVNYQDLQGPQAVKKSPLSRRNRRAYRHLVRLGLDRPIR